MGRLTPLLFPPAIAGGKGYATGKMPVGRLVSVAVIVVITFLGCDLFTTREAEAPQETTDLCLPATSSDQVTSALGCVLQFHLSENYLEYFQADDYEFMPDGAALNNYPELIPWGYQEEATHIRRMFSAQVVPADSVVWVQFEEEEALEWGDSARYIEIYDFHIGHILSGVPNQVHGRVEFVLERTVSGTWVIRRWRDEAVGDEATWSDIKALIR